MALLRFTWAVFLNHLLPIQHADPNSQSCKTIQAFLKTSKLTTKYVYMTLQQNTKHLPSLWLLLGGCNKPSPISTADSLPGGLELRIHTIAVTVAGAGPSSVGAA